MNAKQHVGVPIDHEAVRRHLAERARALPPLGYYRAGTGPLLPPADTPPPVAARRPPATGSV